MKSPRTFLSCCSMLLLVASHASATEPAVVHVVLHPRTSSAGVATFVDIAVQGTVVPIRLVRRVDGVCATRADESVLVRVTCAADDDAGSTPTVTFEIAREGDELVVRRSNAPAAGDDATEPQVIARGTLPPHAGVTVR